jgi:type I restriction enzyme R subunit
MPYTEADCENAVIEIFRGVLGYTHVHAPDLARDYADPLYTDELLPALRQLNPKLPEAALTEAVYKLRNIESGPLVSRNRIFMGYL